MQKTHEIIDQKESNEEDREVGKENYNTSPMCPTT